MSAPKDSSVAGVHTFAWEEEQVFIRLDRIHEDSKGNVSGEITVKTTAPGVGQHLHQARMNLTSTQSRKQVARYLDGRLPIVDWDALVEAACVITLRKRREGEPVVKVGSLPPRTGPRFRLEPILVEGEPNLIYGPGGICKSLLAAFFGLIVKMDHNAIGMKAVEGNVLYLDYETSLEEQNDRLLRLKKGLGVGDTELFDEFDLDYRCCYQPLASEIAEIQRIVAEKSADLVVVDSLGAACGGEPENAGAVISFFSSLRSLNVTSLCIDHVAKGIEENKRTPFGSVYKWNYARNIFELRKAQHAGDDDVHVGLYHRKVNSGRLIKPQGFRILFDDEGESITVDRSDIRNVPELAAGLPLRERITGLLTQGSLSIEDIAAELDTTAGSVRVQASRYKDRFVKLDDGRLGLMV